MAVTASNAAGWLKTTFGKPIEVLGSENTIAGDIKFIPPDQRPGDTFKFPIKLQHPHGVAYNTDHSAFATPTQIDSVVVQASLEGSEIGLIDRVSYGIASKLGKTNSESSRAYKQAIGEMIEGLMLSGELRRELTLLYGSGTTGLANLGVVDAVISAVSTTLVITLTRASFSNGIWRQLKGASFNFHTSGGTDHTATVGTTPMLLTGYDSATGRLTFSGHATDVAAVAAADVITFRGSRTTQCVGLQAIMENSGSLFGISAATYPQWKTNQYAVGGPLTFDKLMEGLAAPSENGLDDGINVYLGHRAWTDLVTDEAALRRHMGSDAVGKVKAGYSQLDFESGAGKLSLKKHKLMKQGIAMAIPVQHASRVGSTDLTFSVPGNKNEWFWRELDANFGSEIRLYSDQAVVLEKPDYAVLFTGITSTSDIIPA